MVAKEVAMEVVVVMEVVATVVAATVVVVVATVVGTAATVAVAAEASGVVTTLIVVDVVAVVLMRIGMTCETAAVSSHVYEISSTSCNRNANNGFASVMCTTAPTLPCICRTQHLCYLACWLKIASLANE